MERWRIGLTADLRIGSTTLRLETVARVGAADRETAVGHDLERAAARTALSTRRTRGPVPASAAATAAAAGAAVAAIGEQARTTAAVAGTTAAATTAATGAAATAAAAAAHTNGRHLHPERCIPAG